jgi:nucleoid-associated protein YgaU
MNPQDKERDNRGEIRDEARKDKAENRDEGRKEKEKTDKPSRLGKEAKIGAAVIVLLLIGLATVVGMRLSGPGSDDKNPPVADRDPGKHKPPADRDDPLFREARSKPFGNHSPTVVTAKASPSKPPTTFESGLNKWKMPPENRETKQSGNRYSSPNSPSSPPAFASDPTPPRPNRYSDVSSSGGPLRKTIGDVPPDPPDFKKPDRMARTASDAPAMSREDFDRDEAGGHRAKPRYDDRPGGLLPPTPAREGPSYDGSARRSLPTTPISRYGDDSAPRSSTRSGFDRDELPRYSGSSYDTQPTPPEHGKYEVRPGDNYSTISQRCYGTPAYFKALAEHNRGKFPNENYLQPGVVISTPRPAELERDYRELCPKAGRRETQQNRESLASTHGSYGAGRTYTVAEGDTLFNIARYELGKASRWAEIYELNRNVLGKDFNYLTPGMKLVLPEGDKSDLMTNRPGETYR